MSAFIPIVSSGAFCARAEPFSTATSPAQRPFTPRMAVDPEAPAASKYMSLIRPDRLNKAPIITINSFSDPNFNSVSVRLGDLAADQGAGDSLKAGVFVNDEAPPPPEKYAKFYDPATVNEAPFISIYSQADGLPYDKHAVCIVQSEVPIQIPVAREVLGDVPPEPSRYSVFLNRLNMAPDIQVNYVSSDEDSIVNVDINFQPLQIVAADEILSKYRS